MARFPAPKIAAPAGGPGVVRVAAPSAKASGAQSIGGKPSRSPVATDTPAAQRSRGEAEKARVQALNASKLAQGAREQGG